MISCFARQFYSKSNTEDVENYPHFFSVLIAQRASATNVFIFFLNYDKKIITTKHFIEK